MLVGYVLMCLIFGTTFVAIKIGILGGFPPLLFAGIRFASAGLLTLAVVKFQGQEMPRTLRQYREILLVGLSSTTITFAGLFWAEQFIPAGLASVLTASAPMISLLWVSRLRVKGYQMLGVLGGMAGVTLVMMPTLAPGTQRITLISAGLLLVCELFNAWGGLKAKRVMAEGIPPLSFNAFQMLFGGIGLLTASLLTETYTLSQITPRAWWAVIYLSVVGSLVARGLYYWLINKAGVVFASTWTYVSPVVNTLVGAWVLGEVITSFTVVGISLALIGVGLTNLETLRSLRRPHPVPAPASR